MVNGPHNVRGDPREVVADPREVRPAVEEPLARPVDTVDALQQRLRAERYEDDKREGVRPSSGARAGLITMIRAHPLPAALAALGLGWLLIGRGSWSRRSPS
ncbi:MAG: hypothetical protein U0360_11340 [Dehalococcoidia bacterium]